ncbi:MAG: Mu transposase C-terminal domain-containing protein [Betaproteobacteria bacterium]|nr:Mu transposase C-terminal domain-containing protein [Betaproteobacteria bacterium]
MVRFRFKKGLSFFQKNVCWMLMHRAPTGKLIFQSDDGETVALTEGQVFSRLEAHTWQIDEDSLSLGGQELAFASPKDLRALSDGQRAKVVRKLAYIQGACKFLEEQGLRMQSSPPKLQDVIGKIAAELDDKEPPSTSTVWRWWKRFAPTQSPLKLADQRRGGTSRKTDEQLRILEEAVSEIYLSLQKRPIKEVVEAVRDKVALRNKTLDGASQIKTPSQATIYRWIHTLYYELVQAARSGKKVTDRELRQVMGGLQVRRVLQRVELDHTPLDLTLVCEETKLVLGRPWLTLAVDRKSRMILGFYICFHAPSASSVLYCLRMAIRPKDDILAQYTDLCNGWPAHGIFEILALDNGMEEHAGALELACLTMGTEILYCAPGRPMEKGVIERLFGTLARALIHQLPGTVFANPDQRGDYPAEELAALDIKTFTRILVKWIVDVYHVTPHRGLRGKTPLQVWEEEAPKRSIDLPAYPAELDTMVGTEATRTVFHYGVEFENLYYNCSLLNEMRRRDGGNPKVQIRAYEHDVGYIDVLEPERKEFVRVPAVDGEYAKGLARATHTLIVAQARRRFGEDWTADQRRDVKREIQEIVAAAMRAKKTAHRKVSAALRLQDSERVLGTAPADALSDALETVDPSHTTPLALHPVKPTKRAFGISTL